MGEPLSRDDLHLLQYMPGDLPGHIRGIFDSMFQGDDAATDSRAMVASVHSLVGIFATAGRRADADAIRLAAKRSFERATAFATRFSAEHGQLPSEAGPGAAKGKGGGGKGELAMTESQKAVAAFERLEPGDWRDRDFVADPEAKLTAEIARVQRWTANVGRYIALDVDAPTGVLLVGPSGTGKTTVAHKIAAANGKRLIVGRHDAIQHQLLGQNMKNVRALIDAAEQEDAYIFLDEVDGLARDRKLAGPTDGHRIELLESILEQLSMLKRRKPDQVVFAATNLPETLDPAFTRRMAITLEFGFPSTAARRLIVDGLYATLGADPEALELLVEQSAEKSADYLRSVAAAAARFAIDGLGPEDVAALDAAIAAKKAPAAPAVEGAPAAAEPTPMPLPRPVVTREHVASALQIIRDRHDKPEPRRTIGGAILLGGK